MSDKMTAEQVSFIENILYSNDHIVCCAVRPLATDWHRLTAENAALVEALEWYADARVNFTCFGERCEHCNRWSGPSNAAMDSGERARKALEKR